MVGAVGRRNQNRNRKQERISKEKTRWDLFFVVKYIIKPLLYTTNWFFSIQVLAHFYAKNLSFLDIGEVNATIPMMAEHLATTSMSKFVKLKDF